MSVELVNWDGKLFPRCLVTGGPVPEGACPQCGGIGSVPEQIDEDRLPVMVPCQACQVLCKRCRQWRKKVHDCVPFLGTIHRVAFIAIGRNSAMCCLDIEEGSTSTWVENEVTCERCIEKLREKGRRA